FSLHSFPTRRSSDLLAFFYGFSGLALSLLRSYLSDRTHHVVVQSSSSPAFHIATGIPQGSVLGPLLFSLYTSPISHILENTNISDRKSTRLNSSHDQ